MLYEANSISPWIGIICSCVKSVDFKNESISEKKKKAGKAQIYIVQRLKKFNISSKSNSYFKADLGVHVYRNKCFSF